MSKYLLTQLFTAITCLVYSQQQVVVSGYLKSESNQPIQAATVSLRNTADTSKERGTVTDSSGFFKLAVNAPGTYSLYFSAIGYESKQMTIVIQNELIDLKTVQLKITAASLSEVIIKVEKPLLQFSDDRVTLNIEKSIIGAGSSVLELLEQIPGIQVDRQNQTIQLYGKAGVRILIDGRPTFLTGAELGNFLQQLNSNSVQKIDVIDKPSSKYDADGNAGIIDIRLKRGSKTKWNGSIYGMAGIGRFDKSNAGLSVNMPVGSKMMIVANYDYNNNKTFTDAYYTRIIQPSTYIYQDYYRVLRSKSHQFRTGLEYSFSQKSRAGIDARLNLFKNNGYLNSETYFSQNDFSKVNADSVVLLENILSTKRSNLSINANYEYKFDTLGQQLTVSAAFIHFYTRQNDNITNQFNNGLLPSVPLREDFILTGKTPIRIDIYGLQVDYIKPLQKQWLMEAGVKLVANTTNSRVEFFNEEQNTLKFNTRFSNIFDYEEQIMAGYILLKKKYKTINIEGGLRYERFMANGSSNKSNTEVNRDNNFIFPNLLVSKEFKNKDRIVLAYNRRIERPSFQDFNPAINFVSYYSTYQGNPLLQPSLANVLSLSYTIRSKYNISISYTRTQNPVTYSFVQDDATSFSEVSLTNFDKFENLSLTAAFPFTITKWWKATLSGNFFRNKYRSFILSENFNNSQYSFSGTAQSNIQLPGKFAIELNYSYRGPSVYGFLNTISSANLTTGVQKTFTNQSTLRLNVTDIFLQSRAFNEIRFQNQNIGNYTLFERRIVRLTYTMPLSKTIFRSKTYRKSFQEEENRVGN